MELNNLNEKSQKIISVGFAIGAGLSMVVLSLSTVILALRNVHLTIELRKDKNQ